MKSKYKKVFSFFLIILFFVGRVYAIEIESIPALLDLNCVDFRVIGLCFKPPGIVGIIIMYWEPALLIETVKRPGDTVIEALEPVISKAAQQAAHSFASGLTSIPVPVTSGSTSSKILETNLQFNEVHVYEFPFRDWLSSFIDLECPDKIPTGAFVKYLSELDALEWRIGVMELLDPKSMLSSASALACSGLGGYAGDLCMGFWGPTYPRRGFLTHQSEIVGSAAAAVRGVSIAGLMGSPAHIVLGGIGFEPSWQNDKLELIYPQPSGCIKIGQNPMSWESGKLSPSGKYLWVYWRRRICCVY